MVDPTIRTQVYAPGTSSLTCTCHCRDPAEPSPARAVRFGSVTCSRFVPDLETALQLSPLHQANSSHTNHSHCGPKLIAFRNPSTPFVCFTLSPTRLTLRDALLQLPLAPARARYQPGHARQLRPPGPLHQVTTLTSSPTGSSHGPASRICLIPAPHTDQSAASACYAPRLRTVAPPGSRVGCTHLHLTPGIGPAHPRTALGMTPLRCGFGPWPPGLAPPAPRPALEPPSPSDRMMLPHCARCGGQLSALACAFS